MVKFVAKAIAVNNSDLYELDGYKPLSSQQQLSVGIESKYKNGVLTVKVTNDDALKYKIAKIQVSQNKANKLFKGDNWEPKLFKGADTMKGSTQGDSLYGFNGPDTIQGNGGDDTIYGGKGKDTLYGNDGGDTMFGGAGKDFLDGGAGVNFLTGDGGKDVFAFSAALVGGNYSQIEDFKPGKDTIQLARDTFEGIGPKGTLNKGKFFLESEYDGKPKSVIYDPASGNLSYSKNGGDPNDLGQVFARIANGAELDHKDFLIA